MRRRELPSPLDLEIAADVLEELLQEANGSFLPCWCAAVSSHHMPELLKKHMVTAELYQCLHLDSQLSCSHLV